MSYSSNGQTIINLEQFKLEQADAICNGAEICWKDTLFFRQYVENDEPFTLIVYADGRKIVTRKPVRQVMSKFMKEHRIYDYDIRCQFAYLELSGSLPCVAGRYRLFSALGASNLQSTWINDQFVFSYDEKVGQQMLQVVFKTDDHLTICFDASLTTFKRNQQTARAMSSFQLVIDRQYNILHGSVDELCKQNGHIAEDEASAGASKYNLDFYDDFRVRFYYKCGYEQEYAVDAPAEDIQRFIAGCHRPVNYW